MVYSLREGVYESCAPTTASRLCAPATWPGCCAKRPTDDARCRFRADEAQIESVSASAARRPGSAIEPISEAYIQDSDHPRIGELTYDLAATPTHGDVVHRKPTRTAVEIFWRSSGRQGGRWFSVRRKSIRDGESADQVQTGLLNNALGD